MPTDVPAEAPTAPSLRLLPGPDEFPPLTEASQQLLWACSRLEREGYRVLAGMAERYVARHLTFQVEETHAAAIMRGLVRRGLLCSQMVGAPRRRAWDLTPLGERLGRRLRSEEQAREQTRVTLTRPATARSLAQTLLSPRP